MLLSIDGVGQEVVVGSAQSIEVTLAWTPRNAAVQL